MNKVFLFFIILHSTFLLSQSDCSDAILVCGNSGYSDLSTSGFGTQELSGSNTCSSQENNSIWFKLEIKTSGTLAFTLTPNDTSINEDFDFFLFGPNVNCGNIGNAIRCSTTNPNDARQGNNLTGMNTSETDVSEGPGSNGNSFVQALDVNAGDSFFLVIDRPIGNSNFDLAWTGTATFDEPPTIDTSILSNNTLNISECDNDGDGFSIFNLQINDAIIGSQTNVITTYHSSNNNAILNTNPIATPNNYTNTSNPQTIFIRLTNTITGCFEIRDFTLRVTPLPALITPTPYDTCDDLASGSDTDGFSTDFILSTKDNEILGSLSSLQYTVSYHTTLIGAQTDAFTNAIDKNIPYRNTIINEDKVYIRVESISNPTCFTVSEDTSPTFKPLRLVVNSLPVILNNPAVINECDVNADLTSFITLYSARRSLSNDVANHDFKFFATEIEAINNTNEIDPSSYNATNGDSVWARVISKNRKRCYRIARVDINISFSGNLPYNKEFISCDDFLDAQGNDTPNNNDRDGISTFDLLEINNDIKSFFPIAERNNLDVVLFESLADRDIILNPIGQLLTNYRNSNIPAKTRQPIYFKVINHTNLNCEGIGEFFILVNPLPEFEITTPQIVCLNKPPIIIEAETPDDTYNYEWRKDTNPTVIGNTEQLTVATGGNYHVTAINTTTNCARTKTITVNESIIASINIDDVIIKDDSTNNSIRINNTNNNLGVGDYEFALLDQDKRIFKDFQDTPLFENLQGGIYTIVVRDKNNCGTVEIEVSVLEFPDFFTPNNDGINDNWNAKGVTTSFYSESNLQIFDRFGKVIKTIQINEEGWNGLYEGKMLPSTDYWFKISLTDSKGNIINRQGNFSLLRK